MKTFFRRYRFFISSLFAFSLLCFPNQLTQKANPSFHSTSFPSLTIFLQPFEKNTPPLQWKISLLHYLQKYFRFRWHWLPPISLPPKGLGNSRRRYRAELLCQYLSQFKPPQSPFIIGFTQADISTTWGQFLDHAVFGLADLKGPAAIISLHRIQKTQLSSHRQFQLFLKITLHEIGHLLGLSHCPTPQCIMNNSDAHLSIILSQKLDFCPSCREKIHTYLKITDKHHSF